MCFQVGGTAKDGGISTGGKLRVFRTCSLTSCNMLMIQNTLQPLSLTADLTTLSPTLPTSLRSFIFAQSLINKAPAHKHMYQ